jgi:quercetin dioxygenase-like cupin family protein
MQITRNSVETAAGPTDWFTGSVYVDAVAAPAGASRVSASSVHFTPGARTHWHTHPNGQTIWVTEGVGLCQRRGGPVEVIRPGDRVFFEPGEEHWHGAAAARFMTHIAMLQVDDEGNPATLSAVGAMLAAAVLAAVATARRVTPSASWPWCEAASGAPRLPRAAPRAAPARRRRDTGRSPPACRRRPSSPAPCR